MSPEEKIIIYIQKKVNGNPILLSGYPSSDIHEYSDLKSIKIDALEHYHDGELDDGEYKTYIECRIQILLQKIITIQEKRLRSIQKMAGDDHIAHHEAQGTSLT